ncbi:MAG TPA: dockerin type I repeat-containing protein [Tepidisphaeraceae bacterium]|jgi:hypothetical protein
MSKKKIKRLARWGLAALPVVTMLCADQPARADLYLYDYTGSSWYGIGYWFDSSNGSYANQPPDDGSSAAVIGNGGGDAAGPSNITVTYNASYNTGVGAFYLDNGNTLSEAQGYILSAVTEDIGNHGVGTYTQSSGSNTVSSRLNVGSYTGNGEYTLSSGSLTTTGSGEEVLGSGTVAGVTGTFTQTGGTNTVAGKLLVGANSGNSGIYSFSAGGTTTVNGGLYLGYNSGSSGTFNLFSGATLQCNTESVGSGSGAFNQYGGSNTTPSLTLSTSGSSAGYELYAGTLSATSITVGSNGGFVQSGGTLVNTNFSQSGGSSDFETGFSDTTSGQTCTLSGGSFYASQVNVGTGASFTQTGGTLTYDAFDQTGGAVSLSGGIDVTSSPYTLSGGTLSVPSITRSASADKFTWSAGSLTLTGQAFDVTSATSDSVYGGYIYGSYLTLGNGMSLTVAGASNSQENLYGNGSNIIQQTGSSNTTTNLYVGSTGTSTANYLLLDGSLSVTDGAYIGHNLNEGGSTFPGLFYQDGGTAQFGSLTLGDGGMGIFQILGGSATVTNATSLDAGASLQVEGGSFTTGSFAGPGSALSFTSGSLTLTNQLFDVTTTTDPTYNGFIYGSALTLNNGMSLTVSGFSSPIAVFGSGSSITQASGSSVTTLNLYLGDSGTGATPVQYNLNGGTLLVSEVAYVGAHVYDGQSDAVFTQSGGTSSIGTLDIGYSGTGQNTVCTLSSGTMTIGTAVNLSNGTFHQSGGTLTFPAFNQSGGTANFDNGFSLTSSKYSLSGGALTTASITGPGSNLTWTNGSLTLSNQVFDVTSASSDPSLGGFIYGSALTLNNGMSLILPTSSGIPVEFEYGSGSSITQNSGSSNSPYELLMGSTGTGTPTPIQYTLNGGTLSATYVILGYNGQYSGPGAAGFTQTGGTLTSATTYIGQNGASTYSLSGGTASFGNLYVGESTGGNGTLTISGTGAATASVLSIGYSSNANGVVNLGTGAAVTPGSDGSLTVGNVAGGGTTGTKTFNFNGGTLQASGNSTTFLSGLNAANVLGSGAFINNRGYAITISQPLLHGAPVDGGLTSSGSGTLTLSGANTYTGTTTVTGGTFTLAVGGSLASSVVVNTSSAVANIDGSLTGGPGITAGAGGVVNLGANTSSGILLRTLGTLIIESSGHVNVLASTSPANRTLLTVSILGFSGNSSTKSELDLANNDMIVHGGSVSPIQGLLDTGFNNGAENGYGIISSAIATEKGTALGFALNSNGSSALMSTFDGQPVTTTDLLIKYTWLGDSNLDGVVNSADLAMIKSSGTTWTSGDFNYDGKVNADDYSLFMLGDAASGGANISTLPEPAITLAVIATLLYRRRGRAVGM